MLVRSLARSDLLNVASTSDWITPGETDYARLTIDLTLSLSFKVLVGMHIVIEDSINYCFHT